ADLTTQPAEKNLKDIHLFVVVVAVEVIEQLDRADHRAGAKHQAGQKPKFKGGQVDRRPVDGNDLAAVVHDQGTDRHRVAGLPGGPAHDGVQARHQLI